MNAIQETAWRINQPVLDVLREVWDGGGDLGGLLSRVPFGLPPKPLDLQTNEVTRERWEREAASVHDLNAESLSKRLYRLWLGRDAGMAGQRPALKRFNSPYGSALALRTRRSLKWDARRPPLTAV